MMAVISPRLSGGEAKGQFTPYDKVMSQFAIPI